MRIVTLCLALVVLSGTCHAKSGRTFYTEARLAAALERVKQFDWARNILTGAEASAARWVKMSDQELWDFVPPPEELRALNVSFGVGCPVHREEIFRKGGHYPWTMSPDKPFKVTCPVGGESYPSNDFEPWNTKSLTEEPQKGPGYVDHGAGWVNDKGERFFFVGYYVFWQRWQREVLPAINQLAQAYLLTGKPVYAHKCAVLMCKLASEYEQLDYPTQAYHNGKWPAQIGGRVLDYIWTTGTTSNMATAYDAIYPALSDPELQSFLKTQQIADPRQTIEQKMLRTMATDIMRGFIKGNEGMHQQALATVAIVLDNNDAAAGPTTKEMVDWIMTGPGNAEYLLWNGFYRDGLGGESSPGYSSGWISNFYELADLLTMLKVDIWSNPKLKKMADLGLDLVVAGLQTPSIGDSGSIRGGGKVGWSGQIQGPAFAHTKNGRFAAALKQLEVRSLGLFEDYDAAAVAAAAQQYGPLDYKTRNLGGYGVAILESGAGANRRGVSMYYGHSGGGHGHRDRLTLEMLDARFKDPVLNDLGYPAHWLDKCAYWTTNTVSHYAVVVNESGQQTNYAGHLNTLASAPGVQLMDASADEVAYPGTVSLYRRTVALVDLSPESSYLLDVYRVKGGFQHDYSFHGPAFPQFSVSGGTPGPVQDKGTLAGVNVPFGTKPPMTNNGVGQTLPLRGGAGVSDDNRPYDQRSLDGWSTYYSGPEALCRKVGAVMSLKTQVPAGKYQVFLHAYDYNAGTNAVDVTIGDQTTTLTWEPSGTVGYRFVSGLIEVKEPAEKITLTAKQAGQSYILLETLTLSTDLKAKSPRVWDPSQSGFQYLYNLRPLKPEGAWSATWSDPTQKQALTLTMPEGCAQEVILADAEPELQPGAPPSLQYLLARNKVAEGDDLSSTYAGVIEPHQGPAQVTAVQRLKAPGTLAGTIGLQVVREGGSDLIHSSLNPGERVQWQVGGKPLTCAGEFGIVRLDARGVQSATLVNGTELSYGDLQVKAQPSPAGKVLAVDHQRNAIVLDGALPLPADAVGQMLILGNNQHQTSYTIQGASVAGGKTTVSLGDTLCLVGMGKATAVDAKAGTVTTDTRLTGYGMVDGGKHAGRWLYNEDKSRGFLIKAFSGTVFTLADAPADLDQVFADADGDGLTRFWISDLGPGDTYRLPSVTQVQRTGAGLYRVRLASNVELQVPEQ